ncbi:MAG: hypothetical protein ABIW50_04430 [Candidatus Limnocylindria bacterium]
MSVSTCLLLASLIVLSSCSTAPQANQPASQAPSIGLASIEPTDFVEPSPSAPSDPLAACEDVQPTGDPFEISLGTVTYAFDAGRIEGPRHCQPFVIVFTNSDPTVANNLYGTNEHDVTIRLDGLLGPLVFEGERIGQSTVRYEVPGLPEGEHYLYCTLHSVMSAELIVASAGS